MIFFSLSYFFCWPDCIPACLGSVFCSVDARCSLMWGDDNGKLQLAHSTSTAVCSFRCCTNFKQRGLKCIVVRGSCTPVSHWSSHHNAVFYWETFGPAIHILPWDTAQLTMAVALPDHYSLWSQLLCRCVCVCVICKMEVVIMSWSLTHSWSQWILHKDCGQQIKDVASFS